ncbi:phosphoribosyltransferase-like protein [Acidovorax sp. NCPPB 4044]|uniref:phosphoribosyltransferase-like protein n=1 Tax=Acidovorax sp. NCPPB 4044 TaxID=2940490 RepID=UPI003FA48045
MSSGSGSIHGARIDVFRRENEGVISNEQVVASSEITVKKWTDLKDELRKLLDTRGHASAEATFKRICLIDDFTASGSTMVRYENNKWKGKLHRFCSAILPHVGQFIAKRALIHVHHYLGTEKAEAKIDELVSAYGKEVSNFQFLISFSHVLSGDVVVDDAADEKLVSLIKSHYDKSIEKNSHLGVDVWYGYGQCGLPVVLDHNSPNNSIALIWARGEHADAMRPLFPRKQRHVQHGQSV